MNGGGRKGPGLTGAIAIAALLLFCAAMAVFTVMRGELDFQLDDTARSLETSRGRERKQQAEYDEAAAAIPQVREELEEVRPLAQEAKENVKKLKEERKRLREENAKSTAAEGGAAE